MLLCEMETGLKLTWWHNHFYGTPAVDSLEWFAHVVLMECNYLQTYAKIVKNYVIHNKKQYYK